MSAPASLPGAERPRSRTVELALAHAHLRLGSLALARVELESLAGLGRLDTGGLIDLAEVRWRTGDLLGAGEAAVAALRDQVDDPVALVIAAEAAAALGRPTEARRLASLAMARAGGSIDLIFAGMPRSGGWPGDAAEPPPTAPTLFDREPEPAGRVDARDATGHDGEPAERVRVASPTAPVALGFWDGEAGLEPAATMPDPASELEAGRAALMAGAFEAAALRFSLALRLAPALAPAVLEATSGARGSSLTMVRGDAYRLAGHEEEARQAYAIAAQGGPPERRRRPRPRQKTRVATSTDAEAALAADIATDTESEVGTDVIVEAAAATEDGTAAAEVEADAIIDADATEDGTAAAEVEADAIIDADADAESAAVHADPAAVTAPPEDADAPEGAGDDATETPPEA